MDRDEKCVEGDWIWVRSPSSRGAWISSEHRALVEKVSDKGTLTVRPFYGHHMSERTESIMRSAYGRIRKLTESERAQLEDDKLWATLKLVSPERRYRSEIPTGNIRIKEVIHASDMTKLLAELGIAEMLLENARKRSGWDEKGKA